ncbi:MAG: hypothetical protein JXA87_05400 [Thermoleophilia bacterium]|nr:hypothetical protein [Thermoleophilia bacterium]
MTSPCLLSDGPARPRRHPAFLGLLLMLFVASGMLGACGAVTPENTGYYIDISYDPAYLAIAAQAGASDIVVAGTVLREDPTRWNSADGKRSGEGALAYTTFYVEPVGMLQGTPAWGTPIAIRAIGGALEDGDSFRLNGETAPMKVGDEVILFGTAAARWGEQAVYQPAEAYWLTADANSVWVKQGDRYVAQGYAETEDDGSLTLEELKAKLAEAAAAAQE